MVQKVSIERIEPPCWWVGMHHAELQVMVYGPNIASLKPTIKAQGVTLKRTLRTDNPNYLFLSVNIGNEANVGTFEIEFNNSKNTVLTHAYELKQRRAGSAKRTSFSSADVIYLLMPDRFSNGNPENVSHPEMIEKVNRKKKDGRHGGNIEGIIGKLGYLADLGITALWPTPLLEDNMDSVSYHSYAITNLYRIDPRFGTNEDYVRLATACKKKGIKLIKDLVPNHIGLNHWWMKDLPAKDWIHQHLTFTRSNHRKEVWHDPYVAATDRNKNETGWFDTSMPDLNQGNALLLTYLKQNAIWWVEYANLEGIRVDTYPYMDQWLAADWIKAILNEYPNLNIVGECWMQTAAQTAYWQTGAKNSNGYDSNLPSVMDFQWQAAAQMAFNEDVMHWDNGMIRFYNNFSHDYLYPNPQNLLVFLDNHDTQRFAEAVGHDINKVKLGITHLLTTRGIPQIYYGTEIMMGGSKQVGDDDLRREIPGGWDGDDRDAFTPEGRTNKENEVFKHMRKLLHYRKNNAVMQTGNMMHYIPEDNVYVYFRYNDEKTVMVVLNNSLKSKTLRLARFKEAMGASKSGTNVLTGRNRYLSSELMVKAKTGLVIELN